MKHSAKRSLQSFWRILSIWAVSLGCSVGWGAFVMPGTVFLPTAGPVGTVIAMLAGSAIVLVVAANFHNMMNRSSHTGGVFAYTSEVFSYDHSLMCVWSIVLAYIAILWANATAATLISRHLFGGIFQFGFEYTVLGYDVYFGECLVSVALMLAFGFLAAKSAWITRIIQTLLAVLLFAGVVVCFLLAFIRSGASPAAFSPPFSGGERALPPLMQVLNIVSLAPWAFIGFCAVSLLPGKSEFADGSFPRKKSFAIMAAAILAGMAIYVLLALLATLSLPEGCATWQDYIADLSSYGGLGGIPTFNAARELLGRGGVVLLALCVAAGILTGILGMYRAAARLLLSLAEDDVLPAWFGKVSGNGLPENATYFIMGISLGIPFLGRTAIGWIVDVTTISAAIAYAYVSAASLRVARREKNLLFSVFGVLGIAASAFFFFPFIPSPWEVNSLASESYLILMVWGTVGLVIFRYVFKRDRKNRFGNSTIMWIVMLSIVLLSSALWMRQVTHSQTENIVGSIAQFHLMTHIEQNIPMTAAQAEAEYDYMEDQMDRIRFSQFENSLFQFIVIVVSLAIMINIFSMQRKRQKQFLLERNIAVEKAHRFEMNLLERYNDELEQTVQERTQDLKREKEKSEQLLLNILPAEVARELADNPDRTIAQNFPNVTVLFTDIVGFTKMSGDMSAEDVVAMLNRMVTFFDERAQREGIEKIKTIGDAYMAAAGLSEAADNDGAERMVRFAMGLLEDVRAFNESSDTQIQIRIGINTGNIVAGVIGKTKFIYDVWGDTVNVASRMESTGRPMQIHVTEATFAQTKGVFAYSGGVDLDVKGKGTMKTYYL